MIKDFSLTLEAQQEYFENHKKDILSLNYRFAVVGTNWFKGYDSKEEVYKDFPKLNPNTPKTFGGTSPIFIDIGKETNSLEYRIEKNTEEIEECNNDFKIFKQKRYELKKERKELKKEKRKLFI